jgi:hypothetical protein
VEKRSWCWQFAAGAGIPTPKSSWIEPASYGSRWCRIDRAVFPVQAVSGELFPALDLKNHRLEPVWNREFRKKTLDPIELLEEAG